MMLDKRTGRYQFIDTKWVRLFVRTPKTTEGWEFQFEIGPLHRGPGVWYFGGPHKVLTIWFSPDHSLDIIHVCGKCKLCEILYNTGKSYKRWRLVWT